MAAKGRSIQAATRPRRTVRQRTVATDGRWEGYVEIFPGVWQPANMAAAERWKRQQLRRGRT